MLAGLTVSSYYTARVGVGAGGGEVAGAGAGRDGAPTGQPTTKDTIRAYIALTKPRIIELLLVTTVPAMVLATRDLPGASAGVDWPSWGILVFWTMIGGTLAAGSANAINCYLDRDIDLLMTRTRRRPLPAHQVEPERAVVFGIALGVISFVVMVYFVNLTAAFLTLLAIGFYVVVYTMILKRSTPQNIVIGGAAGALPPVIGWAAVTGQRRPAGAAPVPARLLLDPAAFLGAVAADPQGLRRGRRADAARRQGHPRDDPPDRAVHDPDGRDLAGPVRGRPDGPDLPRGSGRPRRRSSCGRHTACGGAVRPRKRRPPARSGSTSTRSAT